MRDFVRAVAAHLTFFAACRRRALCGELLALQFVQFQSRAFEQIIETVPSFDPGTPQMLFEGDYSNVDGRMFDLSPDGGRFLMIQKSEQESAPTQLNVVLNWFEELELLVPTNN